MSRSLEAVFDHVAASEAQYVEDLQAYLRHPSISAQGSGMQECAAWLVAHLQSIGLKAWLTRTDGYPVVCGEIAGETDRWVVVYGHYDVQPPEPLDAWIHPPFDAVVDGDRIYARGAVDNKGNLFCTLKAVQSYIAVQGKPPVGVKFFIEGEEEVGSPNLAAFAEANRDWLRADGMLAQDGMVTHDGRTWLNLGMKGILYCELSVQTHDHDLHSGKAPVVDNAAWRLIEALASMRTADGRVAVEGFYDGVEPPSQRDLDMLRRFGPSEEVVRAEVGLDAFPARLAGRDALRALYFEPVMSVCGIQSGYNGPGQATVIPARATAKIDMRLVPGQDPAAIVAALRRHLDAHGFADVVLTPLSPGQPAARTNPDAPVVTALHRAIRAEFGQDPILKPSVESSGPGYVFSDILGLPWALTRFGPADSVIHAPNEFFSISHYRRGIRTAARFLQEFAAAFAAGDKEAAR